MKAIIANIVRGGGKTLGYLLAAFIALAASAVLPALAADQDLDGGTQSITSVDALKGHIWHNGTLNVSANQNFNDATTTLGTGLIVNQTAGMWGTSGTTTLTISGGAVVNYTSSSTPYFIKRSDNTTYGGTTQITFDNGSFSATQTDILFTGQANSTTSGRDVVANLTMKNNSSLAAPSDKNITFGGMEQANSKKHKTLNVTVSVTDSEITAKQIVFGQSASRLDTPASSANNITFGSGATVNLYHQLYAYQYPAPTIKFNGATVNYLGDGGTISFIGQNVNVTTDIYEIQSGGLTIDIPTGKTVTTDSNASALKGSGGVTKTGGGSITWNNITSKSPSGKMLFTGPLVVSNGTWTSTKGYAASAFKANGGTLVLSGALSAASVALEATDGGTLTLSGATITDASPDLTLAGGGTTDYFTRDSAVGTYALDSLTLGEGAVLDLDANATTIDAINATTTNITATSANPVTINLNFSAAPSAGATFTLFETDSAAKFTVVSKLGNITLLHEESVVDGRLVMAIVEDYTWKDSQSNWGDENAWTKGGADATWADGNNAIFATPSATASLSANATANKVSFTADATVSGSATLTAFKVNVYDGVSATISAPTAGTLEKIGAGTLTLGASRTEQTTVSAGTLAMENGATVDGTKLTLGTDPAKPVTFDYGGQTMSGVAPTAYLTPGADVTLTNGTFTTDGSYAMDHSLLPAVFTIAKDATFQNKSFSINTLANTTNTVNIAGGTYRVTNAGNHWIMQKSFEGRLNINLTDGALMEFANEVYMLTCRDVVDNSTAYLDPSVYCMMNDSTFRVANGKSIRFGYDGSNKNPQCPTLVFAATNSVIDIGYGFYIGNNAVGENTAGSYTADFENCIITARQVTVYQDRPLNAVRFNNTRFVVNQASDWTLETAAAFDTMGDGGTAIKPMTIDAGGLVLDTNGKNCGVKADLQGTGALTKTGDGKLTIFYSQSSSAGLICEAGETLLNAGLTVARPVTVKNGATFTVAATAQSTLSSLSLEAGSTLNIDSYTANLTPIQVTTALTLPVSGTVELKKNGGAFTKGLYPILAKTGITAVDAVNLVPATSELSYEWMVQGDTLVLAVDMGTISGFIWTGAAGDGKLSTDGNWLNGAAPSVAGTDLDFSGVAVNATIIGDIDATFGAVTMGEGVITFKGDKMAATSFTDTSKIAVGANARVTLDGNLAFSGSSTYDITHKVDAGGAFVVAGTITALDTADIRPYNKTSSGYIVAKGLVNNESSEWRFRLNNSNIAKWVVGEDGFLGDTAGYWSFNADAAVTTIKADADFDIDTWLSTGTSAGKGLTFDTTGWTDPSANYTITAKTCLIGTKPLTITGGGTFVCDYYETGKVNNNSQNPFSGPVAVTGTATLAINSGKKLTTGTITFAAGTTLEVPSTGVKMGAIAFSGEGTVTLKVSDASLADGEYTLITSTADLPAGVATRFEVALTDDNPGTPRSCVLYTPDNRELKLLVGDVTPAESIWTGMNGDGKMSTPGNWVGGVPSAGADVRIPSTTAEIDNDIVGFAPASITFGYGSGAVTIGGNPITGVVAITNLSTTASHTINVPVYFSGDIQVKQAAMAELGDLTKAHITFAGGAYAAQGYAIENGNFTAVFSRCMFGKYYLAPTASDPWTANVQGSGKRNCLADNSTLYVPYAGRLHELYIGNGSKADVGGMAIDGGRISYKNFGEYVVTNLTLSGTGDRFTTYNQGASIVPVFKFERIETSMTGNWFYFSDGNGASKGVFYIGAGGLNFSGASAKGCYCIGRDASDDAQTLRPWYSDFTIADRGDGNKSLVINRDVTFCTDDEEGTGRTITVDAIVQGNYSPTITVSGSGTLRVNNAAKNLTQPPVTVTNTATLAIKPGASLTTNTTTLNSGTTLEVAESGTVTLGGDLTLKAGATLGFNYTTRNEPVLDLSGKTVTFDEGETTNLVVKITTTDGKRAKGGANVLTSGGKFAGVTVSPADGAPDWVKGYRVENGDIVIDVKPIGTVFLVR